MSEIEKASYQNVYDTSTMDELKACPLPKECQYCEHFELSDGDAVCEKGHTVLMCCNGKDFELDLFIVQAINRRTQPENKPLSLEELMQMDTKPVYCVGIKNKGLTGYGLVCSANNEIIDSFCDMWAFEDYEKEYVAYAHKPEQEENQNG